MPLYQKYDLYFWKQHDAGLITLDDLRELRLIRTLHHFNIDISHREAKKYFEAFFEHLLSSMIVNEEMNNLLVSLKEKVNIAILTNGKSEEQNIKIDNLDLRPIFENNIFISQDIGFEKPDANAFLKVTSEFNVTPEECLFVGDSLKNDILGALNVNMPSIWLNNSNEKRKIHKNDNLCIFKGEIESLLKKLLISITNK